MKHSGSNKKPAGIALMLSLVIIVILTAFITEFFFSTGLELRAMQTFRESSEARNLAKLAFKAVQIGLLMDEVELMRGYEELKKALQFTAIPWEEGLLMGLELEALDSHYNLNELYNIRENEDREMTRFSLYQNIIKDITLPSDIPDQEPEPLDPLKAAEIFAALFDWIDKNDLDYQGYADAQGAEAGAYFNSEPEVRVKNGKLDRLTEIRLVRGVLDSEIPWKSWEENFSALPKSKSGELYPEKLNVNLATHEEIIKHLERRRIDDTNLALMNSGLKTIQIGINEYADLAKDIAQIIAPGDEEGPPTRYDKKSLKKALGTIQELKPKYSQYLFKFNNQYYRVKITTAMNEVEANLEAVVKVKRKADGTGLNVEILNYHLD